MEALYPVIVVGCVILFIVSIRIFSNRLSEERDRRNTYYPGVEDDDGGFAADAAVEVGLWLLFGA
jgi:hypothetical protein